MWRTSIFFRILRLMCCVFGADVDEKKSVMEGDSVTLNSDQDIHGIILVQWKFGDKGSTIAEIDRYKISYPEQNELFRGRLKLNQTGSLTINNIRTKHSGLYKVQIDHRGPPLKKSFKVDVCEVSSVSKAHKTEMKSISVTEGKSAVLHTDVTELQGDELIVWRFGDEGKLLAKEDKETKNPPYYDHDEGFRNRLKLNDQTGSLTINNMKYTDAGLYTVKINSNKQITYKKLIVSVRGSASVTRNVVVFIVLLYMGVAAAILGFVYYRSKVSGQQKRTMEIKYVQQGESFTLKPDTEIESDDEIQWMFGDKGDLIAKMGQMTGKTREITYPDERFKDRLELNKKTGSLTIKNITIKHTGVFKVKISSSGRIFKVKISSRITKTMFFFIIKEEKVRVIEGDTAVLQSEIQTDDQIEWTFEYKKSPIAEVKVGEIFLSDGPDGMFKDTLDLDQKTGCLTIRNIRCVHAGEYCLKIKNSKSGVHEKRFTVAVIEETVTFMEGDAAVLQSTAEIQNHDQIEWRFNYENPIAEVKTGQIFAYAGPEGIFKDRLELDKKTGVLTIKNIRREHAGIYQVKIMNSSSAVHVNTFTVFVDDKPIKFMEGTSAVLQSAAEIQTDDQIEWRFNYKKSPIAEINQDGQISTSDGPDGMFKDTLELDKKTGSLTIRNIRPEHAGFYLLKINNSRSGAWEKRFTVAVMVSKRKRVKNSAIEETPLLHEETPVT